MTREEVEMCPHCMSENIFEWDVEKDGYEVNCQHCGEKIMLCDACFHSDDNPAQKCDWSENYGCWRKRKEHNPMIDSFRLAKRIVNCLSDGYDDEENKGRTRMILYNELLQISDDSFVKLALLELCERIEELEEN